MILVNGNFVKNSHHADVCYCLLPSTADDVVVRGTVWRGAVWQQGCSTSRDAILQIIKNENNAIEGQVGEQDV